MKNSNMSKKENNVINNNNNKLLYINNRAGTNLNIRNNVVKNKVKTLPKTSSVI